MRIVLDTNILIGAPLTRGTPPDVDLSPDPKDKPILAAAIAGKAHLTVSGDKRHMLALGQVEGIPIVSPTSAIRVQLDAFWSARRSLRRKGRRWLNLLKTLVFYRLLDPGGEWRLHRPWFEAGAMADLLGEDVGLVQIDKLYRCLDKLPVHKEDFFGALKARSGVVGDE